MLSATENLVHSKVYIFHIEFSNYSLKRNADPHRSEFSIVELLGKISSEFRKTPHFSAGLSCREDCHKFELFGGFRGGKKVLISENGSGQKFYFGFRIFEKIGTEKNP